MLIAPPRPVVNNRFMDPIYERMMRVAEDRGMRQADLARALGIDPQHLPNWRKRRVPPTMYPAIAKALGLSLDWLVTGAGPDPLGNTTPGPSLRPAVPLISWVQAGNWTECHDPYPPGVADEWINPSTRVSACAFALSVRGDSMEPRFVEGDTIIVDPELEARTGDFVIVRLDDAQEATFKQLVIDGPQRFLKPLNARYPVIPINGNATVVGVVVEKRQVFLR